MRSSDDISGVDGTRRGPLSVVAAVAALVAVVPLALLFYGAVGFPANLPLAFGCAVLLAEMGEITITYGSGGLTPWTAAKALVHGTIVAAACWLGVWVVRSLGWMG